MNYARLSSESQVVEVLELPTGFKLEDCFSKELLQSIVPLPKGTGIGWSWDGTKMSPPDLPTVDLDAARSKYAALVDNAAEAERSRYITGGSGQAMAYARKVEQARALLVSDGESAEYPMLAASVGIDGDSLRAVAERVLELDAAWEQIGAEIERVRLTAKRDVAAAETLEAIKIAASPEWPSSRGESK